MHVFATKFKFHLPNSHTLHPWICLSWEALPARLLIPSLSQHASSIPFSERTLIKKKIKSSITFLCLCTTLQKNQMLNFIFIKSTISKLQACSCDQVRSVNNLCLIKHLELHLNCSYWSLNIVLLTCFLNHNCPLACLLVVKIFNPLFRTESCKHYY